MHIRAVTYACSDTIKAARASAASHRKPVVVVAKHPRTSTSLSAPAPPAPLEPTQAPPQSEAANATTQREEKQQSNYGLHRYVLFAPVLTRSLTHCTAMRRVSAANPSGKPAAAASGADNSGDEICDSETDDATP